MPQTTIAPIVNDLIKIHPDTLTLISEVINQVIESLENPGEPDIPQARDLLPRLQILLKNNGIDPTDLNLSDPRELKSLRQSVYDAVIETTKTPQPEAETEIAPPEPQSETPSPKSHQVDKYLELQRQTIKDIETVNRYAQIVGESVYQQYFNTIESSSLSQADKKYLINTLGNLLKQADILKIAHEAMGSIATNQPDLFQAYLSNRLESYLSNFQVRFATSLLTQTTKVPVQTVVNQALEKVAVVATQQGISPAKIFSDILAPSPNDPHVSHFQAELKQVFYPYQAASEKIREARQASNPGRQRALVEEAYSFLPPATKDTHPEVVDSIETALAKLQSNEVQETITDLEAAESIINEHVMDNSFHLELERSLKAAGADPGLLKPIKDVVINQIIISDNYAPDPEQTLKQALKQVPLPARTKTNLSSQPGLLRETALFSQELKHDPLGVFFSQQELDRVVTSMPLTDVNQMRAWLKLEPITDPHSLFSSEVLPENVAALKTATRMMTESLSPKDFGRLGLALQKQGLHWDDFFIKAAPEMPRFITYLNEQVPDLSPINPNGPIDHLSLSRMIRQYITLKGENPFFSFFRDTLHLEPPIAHPQGFLVRFRSFFADIPNNIRTFFSGSFKDTFTSLGTSLKGFFSKGGTSFFGNAGKLLSNGLGFFSKLGLGSTASAGASAAATGGSTALTTLGTATAPAWLPTIAVIISIAGIIFIAFIVVTHSSSQITSSGTPPAYGDPYGGSGLLACLNPVTPTSYTPAPDIVARGQAIVKNLRKGYWNYWNDSTIDYPELYDTNKKAAAEANPNICYTEGCNLFWCTYLIIKSYSEVNHDWAPTNLRSDLMMQEFCDRGKFVSAADASPTTVVPGSVIFFYVQDGPQRINHVALVTEVGDGYIRYIQSNASSTNGTITLTESGAQSIPGITVVGFGLP